MRRAGLGRSSTNAARSKGFSRPTCVSRFPHSRLSLGSQQYLPCVSQCRSVHNLHSSSSISDPTHSRTLGVFSRATNQRNTNNHRSVAPLSHVYSQMYSNLRRHRLHTLANGMRRVSEFQGRSLAKLSRRHRSGGGHISVSTISEHTGQPDEDQPKKKKKKKRKYESALPDGHYMDPDDTYIPEVDWDHTRLEAHYNRLWEPRERPTEPKEKFYQFLLESFVALSCVIVVGVIATSIFIWRKMKKQLKFVQRTQRSLRKIRPIFDKHGLGLIPFDIADLDVTRLKEEMYRNADENGKLDISQLHELSETYGTLRKLRMPLEDMINFEGTGKVDAGDMVFFLALMQYFCGQPRRKGTPSIRRVVRDDMYKIIGSFNDDGVVTLEALGHYCAGCFFLAILSPPNLGNEKIGGQTLDEFRVNYARYMLRDETIQPEDEIVIRKFNFLYKICDFGIGLTAESRGQLQK